MVQEFDKTQTAYRRMKETIDQTYAKGWFVGLANDKIVGAARTFGELERVLRDQGIDARSVLVVQAGVTYPDYLGIFA